MKRLQQILAAVLCLALLFSLAACGKQSEKEKPEAEATPVPEYVYQASFTPLEMEDNNSMWPLCFTDEGFYAYNVRYIEEEAGEADAEAEDTAAPEEDSSAPEEAAAEESADSTLADSPVYEYFFVGYDGEKTKLNISAAEAPKNTENRKGFYSFSNIAALVPQEDGRLLCFQQDYVSYYDGPEGLDEYSEDYYNYYVNHSDYLLRLLNADGTEISSTPLNVEEGMYLNGDGIAADEKGNLVMSYSDGSGNWGVIAFTPEGETAYQTTLDGYVNSLLRLKDGRVATTSYGMNGLELRAIDGETGKLSESFELPDDAWDPIQGSGDYDLYYTSGVKLYGYKLGAEEPDFILDWMSCDVNGESLNDVYVGSDGTVSALVNHFRNRGSQMTVDYEIAYLTQVPYESVPEKTHLSLACLYPSSDMLDMVIDFNRGHENCRIDVKDYSEYNTDEDYSAGLTKLTTEVLAGNMPDLLYLSGLPYQQLAGKGLLEDLNPWLDSDPELSREDLFASVLQAMEANGGLYQVSSTFSLMTVAGPKQIVGDRMGWTYADVQEALDAMPEGCEVFGFGQTKTGVLRACLSVEMERLIDWEAGKCSFDSPAFIEMLNFANQFEDEANYDVYDDEVDSDYARISQGKQLLTDVYLSDYTGFQQYDFYFGGKGTAAYVGFPTSDGSCGSAMQISDGYGMSANCADKEAAWDFLRGLLTEDASGWGYPVNIKLFNEGLKEAMTPYYRQDETGAYVLDENGEKIEESHMSVGFGNNVQYDIYAMTQEQADQLMALIENTTKTMEADDKVIEIIFGSDDEQATGEVSAFFKGQKTAEEVAKQIQSRVNIYVNEQK